MLSISRIVPISFRQLFSYTTSLVNVNATRNFSNINRRSSMTSISPFLIATTTRNLSVQPITERIKLIREDEPKTKNELQTSKSLENSNTRPLALILTWLMARPKQQMKFAQLYLDQGFDVLLMETKPYDVMWPNIGTQKMTLELLEYLRKNDGNYEKMTVHGFSVGGYVWGEILRHYLNNPSRYQPVMDRFVAQTWDSVAGLMEVPIGVSKAVFPNDGFMRKALKALFTTYMRVFYSNMTRHLKNSSDNFGTGLVKAPGLFFVSKADTIGTEETSRGFADNWIKAGIKVSWKCFDSSPHVGHFVQHREEYIKWWADHLDSVQMLKNSEAIKSKL